MVKTKRQSVGSIGIVASVLALAAAPQASAYELTAVGKTGWSAAEKGTCKYGVFGPRGVLKVGVSAPVVTGANTRRRTRRERTIVRYRVDVTNASANNETVWSSGWSASFYVRQSEWLSLPPAFFDMNWQGYYGADVLIEWWTSRRKVGYRWHRLEEFLYTDNYNRGPWGPFPSCYRYVFPYS
jgi:hypothetical protein